MRSQIGKISMDQTFMKRASINEAIKREIDEVAQGWGLELIRFELKDINVPDNIERAMILQAEAERNKRAQILSSEGERAFEVNIAEANKTAQIMKAEGQAT